VFKQPAASVLDLKWSVEDIMVADDRAIVRGNATGTLTSALFGAPPTGRSFNTMTVDIFTVRGGQLASGYHVQNWLGAIQLSR
jgi:predicted ester cyclase